MCNTMSYAMPPCMWFCLQVHNNNYFILLILSKQHVYNWKCLQLVRVRYRGVTNIEAEEAVASSLFADVMKIY